jgi:hypothetical protein
MELAAYYGWPSPNPILVLDGKKRFASEWNDGMGDEPGDPVSHPEIALAFENTFPEIKP